MGEKSVKAEDTGTGNTTGKRKTILKNELHRCWLQTERGPKSSLKQGSHLVRETCHVPFQKPWHHLLILLQNSQKLG